MRLEVAMNERGRRVDTVYEVLDGPAASEVPLHETHHRDNGLRDRAI